METTQSPKFAMTQMILGYVTAKAVHVAAKLGLADLIAAQGPMDCAALAKRSGAHKESLYRLLRALASIGIFNEDQDGKFSLTPMAECLREDSPDSVKAISLSTGNVFYKAYNEFLYSVKTGEAGFQKAVGLTVFEYLTKDAEEGKIFDRMMTDIHGDETEPMVKNYDFSAFKKVVDVGGGNGSVIRAILSKNPGVKGVIFDLPVVINRTKENLTQMGVNNCELAAGSFFESVPAGGDAYIMRHILHDWTDEESITILANCKKAMNAGGKVLVVEAVIPKGNDPNPFKWLDLSMLMIGGKERTKDQFELIFSKAGLKLTRVIPVTPDLCVVEGE